MIISSDPKIFGMLPAKTPDAPWVSSAAKSLNYKAPSYGDDSTSLEPVEPKIEYVTGYPFMQLAKRHGADYGDVLIATRFVDESPEVRKLADVALCQLKLNAIHELGELLKLPPWLRGAVGHDVV